MKRTIMTIVIACIELGCGSVSVHDAEKGTNTISATAFVPTKTEACITATALWVYLGGLEGVVELVLPLSEKERPGVWLASIDRKEFEARLYMGSNVWEKVRPRGVPTVPPVLPGERQPQEMYRKELASRGTVSCVGVPGAGTFPYNGIMTVKEFDLVFPAKRIMMTRGVEAPLQAPPP